MWAMSPGMRGPDLSTELATITAINSGSGPDGGWGLLPGRVTQAPPQPVGLTSRAKPLNAAGAVPPLSTFFFHHWAPQKRTWPDAVWSPTTNVPPPGANPKTSVLAVA